MPHPEKPLRQIMLSKARCKINLRVCKLGELPPTQAHHLLSYGVQEGADLVVLAQRPLTIIRVERTEIGLDREVADRIYVEETEDLPSSVNRSAGFKIK
jgi:Fe2+ transport system protein FeoA